MRDRRRALAASRADALRPTPLAGRDATPSQRDFAQYVATGKRGLAAIAGVADGPASAAVAQAQAYDEAEVAAIAVDTSGGALAVADMSVIARATTAPILYDALVLNPRQILQARLFGADAVILPANELAPAILHELVAAAASLHMATVVEVLTPAQLADALTLPHAIIGARCANRDGSLDAPSTLQLARSVPPQRCVIALAEPRDLGAVVSLGGTCDAVLLGDALRRAGDFAAAVRMLAQVGQ